MPPEAVPIVQRELVNKARLAAKPVIVATQMLESMIKAPVPTRAEVSDVANAILDGADAVMLSGETASGQYPLETVEQMARIIEEVERSARYQSLPEMLIDRSDSTLSTAVARACAAAARQLGLPVIAAYTRSGETVRLISEHRPAARLVAFTPSASARRRMSLYWGVESVLAPVYKTTEEMVAALDNMIRDRGYAKPGDAICIASPSPPDRAGGIGASMMQIQRL
jgi:pyruvate kinase